MNGNVQRDTKLQTKFIIESTIKNIDALTKAVKSSILSCQEKVVKENKKFLNTRKDFNVDYESEKISLMYLFILEKHNLKILEYDGHIDSLKSLEERLKYHKLFIELKLTKNELEMSKCKSKLIELIQEQAIRKVENDIQLVRQKKITYNKCNKYIEYLRKNSLEEYENLKNLYSEQKMFDGLENQRNDLEQLKINLIQMFKNRDYDFDEIILFNKDFLNLDVLKILDMIYPQYSEEKKKPKK